MPNFEHLPVRVSLVYYLYYMEFFSTEFEGIADRRHFTRVQMLDTLPPPIIHDGVEAPFSFYPSYPIRFEPKPISTSERHIWYTPYTFYNSYIDLREITNFEAYLARMSAKSRSTLRRKVRKFEQASCGKIQWREYSEPGQMAEFYRQAQEVSRKTYQERLLGCGLPKHDGYIAELIERCSHAGAIGFLLFLNGKPIAYELSYCENGIVFYSYVGFDPEYGNLSAGTVLMYLLIQSLFHKKGIEIFDFTEGESQQKSVFGTHQIHCAKTYVLNNTLSNRVKVYFHYYLDRFATAIGKLMERTGLKSKLKKWLKR